MAPDRVAIRGFVAAALSMAATGCGGEPGTRPRPGFVVAGATDPCRLDDTLDVETIEDFETGRAREWWVDHDDSAGARMTPAAGERSPAAQEVRKGRCGVSRFALHVEASGLAISGGAVGYNFVTGPVGARSRDGISFWARRGSGTSGHTLLVGLTDMHTDQANGRKVREDGEPFCLDQTEEDAAKCDPFAAGVGVEDGWRFYAIPFEQMRQRGYGREAPFFDLSALLGVRFSFSTGDWDIWIDDVAFYEEPEQ